MTLRGLGPLIVLIFTAMTGCQPGAYNVRQPDVQQQQSQLAQLEEFQRRATELDANNRDLHTQLAQSEQKSRLLRDEVDALRSRLTETTDQLAQARQVTESATEKLASLQSSNKLRGGATITANNSWQAGLTKVDIPGAEVRSEDGLIRIDIPADRLFLPGTATLHRDAFTLLESLAAAVNRHYPRQQMAVVGHTDNNSALPAPFRNHHQLSVAQATAVFDQLTTRHRIPLKRLQIVGHGSSRPVASNGTPQGQAKNRRVEIVVFPTTAK